MMLSHLNEDYRVVAGIINCFYNRLVSADPENEIQFARNIESRENQTNHLQRLVSKYKLNRLVNLEELSKETELNFPVLNKEDIKNFITFTHL